MKAQLSPASWKRVRSILQHRTIHSLKWTSVPLRLPSLHLCTRGVRHLQSDWQVVVWLMLRSIYGLKQSALKWYEQVCIVMADLGFTRAESDHALFYYEGVAELTIGITRVHCYIGWHIDDGMGVCNSRPFLEKVKRSIAERFGIKDLGPVTKYLGVQFEWNCETRQLWIHQNDYIAFLLQEYGLSDCNPVLLPADPKALFGDTAGSYPEIPNLHLSYLKIVGELIYFSINTCPDVAYIMNSLAQHNANSEPRHFATAK
jgi:hypothetical protein